MERKMARVIKKLAPVPDEKIKRIMAEVSQLAERYQPLIEHETGVSFGKIKIKRDWLGEIFSNYLMSYWRNRIYPNLKAISIDEERFMHSTVVHELSHCLWDKLSNHNRWWDLGARSREWNEGFAVYCESIKFSGFYPLDVIASPHDYYSSDSKYMKGFEKVYFSVLFNEVSLLEIPKRWPELEKRLCRDRNDWESRVQWELLA